MSSIKVFPPSSKRHLSSAGVQAVPSPLPKLLQTPLGLSLIELQGDINHPGEGSGAVNADNTVTVGRLAFPDYNGEAGDGAWTKRAWLYVGEHQRLTGEVKKLSTPLGVLRRRTSSTPDLTHGAPDDDDAMVTDGDNSSPSEDVEIAEVIRWKIVFSSRPEPVGVV